MPTDAFNRRILKVIQSHTAQRSVRCPSKIHWDVDDRDGGPVILARVDAEHLQTNMQTDSSAASSFLLAFVYWMSQYDGQGWRGELRIDGNPTQSRKELAHWHRSAFVIQEYERAFTGRFSATLPAGSEWRWPASPTLNAPQKSRESIHPDVVRREHDIEVEMATSGETVAQFSHHFEPIRGFERQLPIALFDGQKADATRVTPGGSAQVDLWAPSSDGKTVHLFELKSPGNKKLGILPEAFYYARLLHYVRVGLPNGTQIKGSGDGYTAVRHAKRIVMWLTATELHPLVLANNQSPLEWFNGAFAAEGLRFRILPISIESGRFILQPDDAWPSP